MIYTENSIILCNLCKTSRKEGVPPESDINEARKHTLTAVHIHAMNMDYISHTGEGSVWMAANPDPSGGALAFRAEEAGKFIVGADSAAHSCGRDGYLLLYSASGEGELVYDGRLKKLPRFGITLFDCGGPYTLGRASCRNGDWEYFWIRFKGPGADFYCNSIFPGGPGVLRADTPEIKKEFAAVLDGFLTPGIETGFRINRSITTLLTAMVEMRGAQAVRRDRHQSTIDEAAKYIRGNFNTALDVNNLAANAKLSKYYFIKLFKEYMRVAPYEYVINYRISEAKKYLRMTCCRVAEISGAVGYNDECNFIRTFKRVTGLTPLQYRDRERG